MTEAGLVVTDLSHNFGDRPILDSIDLSVRQGEIVCLLGPSGSGKSTLLRIIAGLERLQSGRVTIAGEEVASRGRWVPPERRGVGLMFQDFALFPHLSVRDNVAFGLAGLPAAARRARAMEALGRVGMQTFADAYPHTLSGGEQQRVALARALAPGPRVMLLDEPFSGLDAETRERVRDETIHLLRNSETPTLLVTHDPDEAMRAADRIVLMRGGRIVQDGPPRELYRRPRNAFCASFLAPTSRLAGRVRAGSVDSPLGPLPADGLSEGTEVEVLVRPEGVRLSEVNGSADSESRAVEAIVTEVRDLGAESLIELRLAGSDDRVTARLSLADPPPLSSRVRIAVDQDRAFVFPRETS